MPQDNQNGRTTMDHLPITERKFDALASKLYDNLCTDNIDAAVRTLTDDELLIWAEVDDKLQADPEAASARLRTSVWIPIREAVDREMATR